MESINDKFSKKTKYDLKKETKCANFVFLNEKFPCENCTVLVGDSLVEKYNPEFFNEYTRLSSQVIFNRGIDGDTSDRMFDRLMDTVINLKPRNIVIEIGTNDFGLGAPVEFTFCNIEKTVNLIKEMLPDTKIIVESVYPVNKSVLMLSSPVGKRENETIVQLNQRLEKLSQTHDFTFLDLTAKLADKKDRLSKEYTYDGLHLNAQGYEIVTNELIKLLK